MVKTRSQWNARYIINPQPDLGTQRQDALDPLHVDDVDAEWFREVVSGSKPS
jgi:hypothetical protein